jgi:O-antigen/teichoic acid export membrane protein
MKRAISNAAWLLAGHVGRIGSQLLGVSIIARILTPADFGVVAIAMVVSNLAGLLRDLGTGPAAIRSRESSLQFYGGIYAVQLLISATLAATIGAIAPILAGFYHAESLTRVLVILSLVFPISALGSVHLIVLEKGARYREISLIELVSYIVGLAVALILAQAGIGIESLAFQAVANAAVQTILLRKTTAVRIVPMHPKHAESAVGGSAAVTSFHLFNYIVRNSDTALAGRLATADFVGSYSMANRIAQMPSQAIGMLLSRVSVPLLSQSELDRTELSRQIGELIELSLFFSAAVCLLLAAFRGSITGLLFGPQWLESVPVQLNYLLPAAALTSVCAVVVGIMTAMGANMALIKIGALSAIAHVCALSVCMCIDPRLLPLAMFISGIASLTISGYSLRLMLIERQIEILSAGRFVPIVLVVAYPFVQETLNRSAQGSYRTFSQEIFEGVALALLLALIAIFRRHRRMVFGYFVSRDGAIRDGNADR